MSKHSRGDTIVEVIVAFAVFALIAVSTTYLMNRSLSVGQRSLEVSLVRQQVDSQAELLRYVRDTNHPVWSTIKASAQTGITIGTSLETCPSSFSSSTNKFVLRLYNDGTDDTVELVNLDSSATYEPASYYSRAAVGDDPAGKSYGLWVTPVNVDSGGGPDTDTYDMYIQGCWDSVGSDQPQTISTIVRLYDT